MTDKKWYQSKRVWATIAGALAVAAAALSGEIGWTVAITRIVELVAVLVGGQSVEAAARRISEAKR